MDTGLTEKIAAAIAPTIASGGLAGAVAAIWRNGELQAEIALGRRDLAGDVAMTPDSLFRIASLSKPVVSVLALMALEAGRFALDDPIARFAPEFAAMRVLRDPAGALADTVPALRPITMGDLLTHRAGFTYGDFHAGALAQAYRSLGGDIDSDLTPDQWMAALARLPLIDQPGAGFHYGRATDLLGFILARIEGTTLGAVLAHKICAPLGLNDTRFAVPAHSRARCAKMYGADAAGGLEEEVERPGVYARLRPAGMSYESAGQGLWSSARDYLRFARLFIGQGEVDGVRLLRPQTMAAMGTNQLSAAQRASARIAGVPVFAGHGFGLGVAVVVEPQRAAFTHGLGPVGTVGWPGAYGSWWQADPTEGSVLVFFAHNALRLERVAQGIGLAVYDAIAAFHAAATAPR